jgi:hypothetical protein
MASKDIDKGTTFADVQIKDLRICRSSSVLSSGKVQPFSDELLIACYGACAPALAIKA